MAAPTTHLIFYHRKHFINETTLAVTGFTLALQSKFPKMVTTMKPQSRSYSMKIQLWPIDPSWYSSLKINTVEIWCLTLNKLLRLNNYLTAVKSSTELSGNYLHICHIQWPMSRSSLEWENKETLFNAKLKAMSSIDRLSVGATNIKHMSDNKVYSRRYRCNIMWSSWKRKIYREGFDLRCLLKDLFEQCFLF